MLLSRVAVFVALFAAACGGPGDRRPPQRPHLVLVTIDTLRADRLGRGLTPTMDRLAASGLQFTQARATAPLTLPSHVSMLTGALPPEHGVRENGIHTFRGSPPSVARTLKERGYRTAAFVGAYVLDRRFGLADGFDHYDDLIPRDPAAVQRLEAERPANLVVDRVSAWLHASGRTAAPVFLWVHFYDPHAPYAGSYDREVTFADAQLGRLLERVRVALPDPIVIVAGDHGESLGDHGEATHGMLIYEAALRVPLIVAGPAVPVSRRDDPVSLSDIAPTLARLGGTDMVSPTAKSLLEPSATAREIYAESRYPRVAGWSPVYMLARGKWKLILSGGAELYDIEADPSERENLASSRATIVRDMAARIEKVKAAAPSGRPAAISPEAAEKLRSLGYVAGPSDSIREHGPNPADHIAAWREFEVALSEVEEKAAAPKRRLRQALPRLERLAATYPEAPVFHSTLARALSEQGSIDAALTIYRRAVAKWPADAVLLHELAVTARRRSRAAEALKAERAALVVEPALSAAHNGIGLLMTDEGRHASAAAAFERAAQLDPTNAEYWVNLGNAQRAAGNTSAAADAYRRAAEVDPASADAANGLGVLLVQQQRAAEAVPLFERALSTSPDFDEARLNLAIAYHESGQRERAVAAYREVIARAKPGSRERAAAADLLRSLDR